MPGTKSLSWLSLVLALGSGVGTAYADATVTVELKSEKGATVDGSVVLVKGETRFTCTTAQGRCAIKSVPGGMYSVEVSVPGKPSPKPKQVMIPPTGEAKLVVNAG